MSIFDSLFGRSKATLPLTDPMSNALAERALTSPSFDASKMGASILMTNTNSGTRRGAPEILQLYSRSPWLRSVSHHVASNVAAVQWKLFATPTFETRDQRSFDAIKFQAADRDLIEGRFADRQRSRTRAIASGDLVQIPSSHPWYRLMDQPNAIMRGKASRQMLITSYDLVGESGLVLDRSGPDNVPVRAWAIPGHWISRRPSADTPTWGINVGGATWDVPVDSFILFQDPNPFQPYGPGSGLGLTVSDELDIDEHAAKQVAAFFQNSALPNAIVSLTGASAATIAKAKTDFMNRLRGFAKSYQTHFVNTPMQVQRMDTSFKDQAIVEIRKSTRDTLQQVWGVPPEKLGIITNSNRATSEAAQAIDASDVMVPRLEMMRGEFQRIAEMFDPRLVVDYDSPVPEDRESKRSAMVAFGGRFTIDEEREAAGLPPLKDGSGSGFLIGGKYFSSLLDIRPEIYAYHLQAGIPTVNEVREYLKLPPRDGGDVPTSAFVMPGAEPAAATPVATESTPATEATPTAEPRKRIAQIANKRAADLSNADIKKLLGFVDVASMFNAVGPVVKRLMSEWGQDAMNGVIEITQGDAQEFDANSSAVRKQMRELANERIKKLINETTRTELEAAIVGAIEAGGGPEGIRSAVKEVFNRARVERSRIIAETESLVHSQFAAWEAFKQTEIEMVKEWIATQDGRARETHADMDGQQVGLDEPFTLVSGKHAGAQAQYPGGFRIAGEDINCRCSVGTVIKSDEINRALSTRAAGAVAVFANQSTADERHAAWARADAALKPWDNKLEAAIVDGFDSQEIAVVDALDELLGG